MPVMDIAQNCCNAGNLMGSRMLEKTRLCKFFAARGRCNLEEACPFAHGDVELKPQPDLYRTRMCVRFMRQGACRFGDTCIFAHRVQDLRAVSAGDDGAGRTALLTEMLEDPRMPQRVAELTNQIVFLQKQIVALKLLRSTGSEACGHGASLASVSGSSVDTCARVEMLQKSYMDFEPQEDSVPPPGVRKSSCTADSRSAERPSIRNRRSDQGPAKTTTQPQPCIEAPIDKNVPRVQQPQISTEALRDLEASFGMPMTLKNSFLHIKVSSDLGAARPRRALSEPANARPAHASV